MQPRIDFGFGIKPEALALAHLVNVYLNGGPELPKSWDFNAYAWYNGRERGVLLALVKDFDHVLYIVFGENRSSDDLFVDSWTGKITLNPPTVADWPEEAYRGRRSFRYDCGHDAAAAIRLLIDDYIVANVGANDAQ